MVCIEVSLDGEVFRMAGIQDASLLSPTLGGFVGDDTPARLTLSGMCDLPNERAAHVYWGIDEIALNNGTVVTFRLTTSEAPSNPDRIVPIDSPEYIEEQREFEELKKTFVPDMTPSVRTFPGLAFHCRLNQKPVTTASLNPGEEHLLCTLLWNKWHPKRLRVSLRSFGNDPDRETEWLRNDLTMGDELEIRVAA
jgi:hypothetical protein